MVKLAEPRRRQQYTLAPRGQALYDDDTRFGTKMLEKMGWSKGKGLGANENGVTDFVRLRYKNDAQGLGFQVRDDQWQQHEDSFTDLLQSLNGDEANGSADTELPAIGFGFTQPAPQKTMKTKISGESLEEKSKRSRARVHYKKFTRGKDLSQYSEKDLANIFGKKSMEEEQTPETKICFTTEGPLNVNKNNENFQSSALSVTDYFKQKMQEMKKRNQQQQEQQQEEEQVTDGTGEDAEINEKSKSEKRKIQDVEETAEDVNLPAQPKKKKAKKNNEAEQELQIEIEEVVPRKKEKKSKKRKDNKIEVEEADADNSRQKHNEEEEEAALHNKNGKKAKKQKDEAKESEEDNLKQNEQEEEAAAVQKKKEKKSKKQKDETKVEAEEDNSKKHKDEAKESQEDNLKQNEKVEDAVLPKKKEKKSKKQKDEAKESEEDNLKQEEDNLKQEEEQEQTEKEEAAAVQKKKEKKSKKLKDETKEAEEDNLKQEEEQEQTAKEEAAAVQKKKEKKSKKDEVKVEEGNAVEMQQAKNSKKKKRNDNEDTTIQNNEENGATEEKKTPKKNKEKKTIEKEDNHGTPIENLKKKHTPADLNEIGKKEQKAEFVNNIPRVIENGAEILQNSNTVKTKERIKKSITMSSFEEVEAALKAANVWPISQLTAEKFRFVDFNGFKGSTLSQIEGYRWDENMQLKIIDNTLDEQLINNLWSSLKNKNAFEPPPKDSYRDYVKQVKEARQKATKLPHFKVHQYRRKNAFTIVTI